MRSPTDFVLPKMNIYYSSGFHDYYVLRIAPPPKKNKEKEPHKRLRIRYVGYISDMAKLKTKKVILSQALNHKPTAT